ncbi:PA2169 family four-helix-bundle protein [Mucilaginibacter litoreus]|uniref:PA2169 family four-helix-bundle protein n=1 Tax=Mucilaginibacter litoreus TaxID=1048221 RepID=A0ABW3ATN1_9SPHI
MENTTAALETLNDLVLLHNDRIEGYERAMSDLKPEETELRYLFTNLIGESHQFKLEIATEVAVLGKDIDTGTTTSGKLHRTWIDLKTAFTGHSKKSVLEECEFGEDAILKAYETAIAEETTPAYIKEILRSHQPVLKAAHDKIKALRDSA